MRFDQPAIRLSGGYASDFNANISGGERTGIAYLGKFALIADTDLDRLLGIGNSTAHLSIVNIHGSGLSSHFVGNLLTVSGNEAEPAIRLNQVWVEVGLAKKARLRIGKFPAAQEFMTSDTAGLFINATFGWAASFATDLPSGGPSWPLAAPGVMVETTNSRHVSLSGAVFAGDPAGPGEGDPQKRDNHGFNAFGFSGRPFVIGEVSGRLGKAVTWKAGGWVHFGRFDRQGQVLQPSIRGNWALYGIIDGQLAGGETGRARLRAFARWSISPPDRNAVVFYADAGIELLAPFRTRPNDAIGLAVARAGLSHRLSHAQSPEAEIVVEWTYRAALRSNVSIQPNVQLFFKPIDPARLGEGEIEPHRRAIVLGMRTGLSF